MASGTLTWSPQEDSSYALWFKTKFDNVDEPDETFKVVISNGSGVVVNDPENFGTIKEAGVVDIDVDSDNNRIVDPDDLGEDLIEYVSGHVGKRVFENIDDDNLNGKPDKLDSASDYGPLDKDFAEVWTNNATYGIRRPWSELDGYEFWLTANFRDIEFWADKAKTSLISGPGVRLEQNSEIKNVIWTLGPGFSGPPEYVMAEGQRVKQAKITGYIKEANGGAFRSWDHVNLNIESTVYPVLTQTYSDFTIDSTWFTKETTDWEGIEVADAWHTNMALEDYINPPNAQGILETIHPDILVNGKPGATQGTDSTTTDTLSATLGHASGFEMTFDYSFERSRNSPYGYVHHQSGTLHKLSFVGNSGIKFGTGGQEVAILDVDAYVNMAGGISAFSPSVGGIIDTDSGPGITAKANINAPENYNDEELSRLMTGVVYGPTHHDYGNAKDNPDRPNLPTSLDRYWTMLASNEQRANGKMRIRFDPAGNGTLTVFLDGATGTNWSYQDTSFSPMSLTELIVQSHWGSGVIFTNMDIKKLP